MVNRVGISINTDELERIRSLQRRFHVKSRSRFFRELVHRYEKLESDYNNLQKCLAGYIQHPEASGEALGVLKTSLKALSPENW